MKNFAKNKIINILSYESKKILAKHKPFIIAITGNIGKTTTKDYINNFLSFKYGANVRASEKSQNSEFGVNLTILGEKNAWNNIFLWLKIILSGFFKILFTRKYPKVLVLEVGADKPGDIKFITEIVKPNLVVLTAFQPSPTHGEYFINIDQHILEKKYLVDALKKNGTIVYNADDEIMTRMAKDKSLEDASINLFSFGYNKNADVRIIESGNLYSEDADILGIKSKFLINNEHDLELKFYGIVGDAQLYSVASSVCVALLQNMDLTDIKKAVEKMDTEFSFSKSRMTVLNGINNSTIIDDSYNASPKAVVNAIETVKNILTKGKRIAILGHMAELGDKTKEEHFAIGYLLGKNFDTIILSGRYNEYYLEGVRESKFDLVNVYLAKNASEVLDLINKNNLIGNNDLVLVKGSQSARLEKVVVDILEDKEDYFYVCRQEDEWINRD